MTETPHDEAQEVVAPDAPVETQEEEADPTPAQPQEQEQEQESSGTGGEPTEEGGAQPAKQGKTWYPYITRNQFEKFVSRLQGRVPDQIDRDYVRAIIRTPSMIYRFLRGIEAMQLIDRNQHPTDRLRSLADQESRRQAFSEILQDLYPELLDQWRQADGTMPDREIAAFFQQQTGMGGDSANKMKMFFKYLIGESGFGGSDGDPGEAEEAGEEAAPEARSEPPPQAQEARPTEPPPPAPPAQSQKPGRWGQAGRKGSQPPPAQAASPTPPPPAEKPAPAAPSGRALSEAQKAYIETVQKVLSIKIDGDWDDDMMRLAFDRLERLFDRIKRG